MSDSTETMCTVCSKPYRWRKDYTIVEKLDVGYIKEVEFVTAHAGCRSLLCKYHKLQDELLDMKWKLIELKYKF